MASIWIWIGAAALTAGAVSLFFMLFNRRQGQQIRSLIQRLESLEAQHAEGRPTTASISVSAEDESGSVAPPPPEDDVLAGFTSHINRIVERGEGRSLGLADQAVYYVHKHLEEPYRPAQLAEELNISLRTLERGLVETFDCTPGQLITAMKMREARRLFASGDHRVNEVASRLGFSSPFYFSRRFRTFFGVPPSEFRRTAGGS